MNNYVQGVSTWMTLSLINRYSTAQLHSRTIPPKYMDEVVGEKTSLQLKMEQLFRYPIKIQKRGCHTV